MVEKRTQPLARDAMAYVLAGGHGSRLKELTDRRAKPAVYFGGKARIIDFALSNALNSGIRRIGVAGHPEGHPRIGQVALWGSLAQKQKFARESAVSMHIVTQFAFDPAAICLWDRHLPEHGIELPVYVGMAGPAPLQKLIKYAMQCGVGASLRGLMRNMTALRNVTGLATSPDEMMAGIVTGRAPGSRIVGPHLYSLGGALATATWLRAVVDGEFTLDPQTGHFHLAL